MLPAARRVATSAHHAYETYETRDARNGEAYPGAREMTDSIFPQAKKK